MALSGGTGWALTPPVLNVDAFGAVARVFIRACAAFNQQDLPTLGDLLADDAVLYRVNSGTPILRKADILAYLATKFSTDRPICAPVTTELHPPSLPTTARGTALWGSGTDSTIMFQIRYEIHFQPRDPYLITSLWARPG